MGGNGLSVLPQLSIYEQQLLQPCVIVKYTLYSRMIFWRECEGLC